MLNELTVIGRIKRLDEEANLIKILVENRETSQELVFSISDGIISNLIKYCEPNGVIGIKGHLEEGLCGVRAVIDKVSILTSKRS